MSLWATGFTMADSDFLHGLIEYWEFLNEFWRRAKNASCSLVVPMGGGLCLNCFSETLLAEKTYFNLSINCSDFRLSLILIGDLALTSFFYPLTVF